VAGIHFIHVRSRHEDALPLIITHGGPGSVTGRQVLSQRQAFGAGYGDVPRSWRATAWPRL
jgi:hypothetical protein